MINKNTKVSFFNVKNETILAFLKVFFVKYKISLFLKIILTRTRLTNQTFFFEKMG
jgi:hypothetical protein